MTLKLNPLDLDYSQESRHENRKFFRERLMNAAPGIKLLPRLV